LLSLPLSLLNLPFEYLFKNTPCGLKAMETKRLKCKNMSCCGGGEGDTTERGRVNGEGERGGRRSIHFI
jgi:hypothetical protein